MNLLSILSVPQYAYPAGNKDMEGIRPITLAHDHIAEVVVLALQERQDLSPVLG